jgi:hypothetical protein|tara:strand:+ start:191 stop:415 length:225 start_codon:yes stop_codon:yes gene_type:complete
MTVVKDITDQVLVPKPMKDRELNKSFFIGRVPMDTEEDTVEVNINKKDNIKQPHLNYSESSVIDTKWKGIKDVY